MTNYQIGIALVLCFICLGCSKPLTYKDNGSTISLAEHAPFEIVLEADSTSDYIWKLESEPGFLELQKPVEKSINGTSETYSFNFKTISFGDDVVKLIYTDGRHISKRFELNVIVGTVGVIEAE